VLYQTILTQLGLCGLLFLQLLNVRVGLYRSPLRGVDRHVAPCATCRATGIIREGEKAEEGSTGNYF